MLDIAAYLERLGYGGPLQPTADTLRLLHRAHMLAVPFENLDIQHKRRIELDEVSLFRKIVLWRRGGFCYELNGLFAAMLRALGFQVTLLSAGVHSDDGEFGPDFDHLALLVETRPQERWLADVGFGDSFLEPLRFDQGDEQLPEASPGAWERRRFRIAGDGPRYQLQQRSGNEPWRPAYRFTLEPRRLEDFAEMCRYHQTSPRSSFTQRRICSLAQPEGRVTLSEMRLIDTVRGERHERALASEGEYAAALCDRFGIVL